jgi:hypothetical protein
MDLGNFLKIKIYFGRFLFVVYVIQYYIYCLGGFIAYLGIKSINLRFVKYIQPINYFNLLLIYKSFQLQKSAYLKIKNP